ncbi:MAG: ATP-dependent DNA helicase PcrA [candidate division TM6 bacterium GW2011_GWE2_36_25]|nr:MAG: ATP-dependent DNA helicase PcrA [candidate division TM6 bacterium GW2011_GWE2_36_25]
MDFAEFLSTELNNEQQKAVRHAKGPLLVIAGAGSGKTRVITSRIINLILTEKVTPTSIIALTFTNKAAQEMRERVQKSIGIPATPFKNNSFFIGTFHSYCLRLLKKNAHILKLDHFSILDGDDQISMLKKLVDAHCPKKIQPRQALYQISTLKNNLLNQQETLIDPTVQELYNLYEHEKRLSNCLDFDDLLIKALELFSSKNFKTAHQNHIRHVLVDEYQDTNVVQNELLKEMCLDKKKFIIDSLCAVGDEDQSIYSWRGATIDNMLNFKKDFPGTTLIKIEQNYRSVKPILEAANHIIKHNQNRHPKKLWSTREGSNNILELTCMSGFQEADMIAASASLLQQKNELQNCAVLYRTHFQSRLIEEALIKKSIPYKIIGGIQFYERKEIKDLLAYLRLLINPFDRIALFRILNCPPRRLGDKFAEQFQKAWEQEPFQTFTDIAQKLLEDLKPQQKSNLEDFINIFSSIDLSFSPAHAINHMSKKCGYLTYLKEEYEPQEAEARIQNIQELINAARYFEEQGLETTEQFLQEIALLQDKINQENNTNERLTLMTIHAAKGLEFDTIILAGLEEGLLPSSKSLENESNIEEERRLLYVGITRARKKLILLQAGYRHTFGSMTYQQPSRFLKELPNTGIQREDCSYWKECQTIQFLRSFFGIIAPEQSIQTFGPAKKFKAASKKDLHSYPSTSSGRAQPLVLSEAEASGRAQPLVLSEAEASGRAQQDERSL